MNRYRKGKEKARNEAVDWQSGFANHNYSITAMVNWLASLIILRQRLDAMGL